MEDVSNEIYKNMTYGILSYNYRKKNRKEIRAKDDPMRSLTYI